MTMKEFSTYKNDEMFYNLYVTAMGFSMRKSHKRITSLGDIKIITWLCSKERFREKKFLKLPNRKRELMGLTREGCGLKFHINLLTGTG